VGKAEAFPIPGAAHDVVGWTAGLLRRSAPPMTIQLVAATPQSVMLDCRVTAGPAARLRPRLEPRAKVLAMTCAGRNIALRASMIGRHGPQSQSHVYFEDQNVNASGAIQGHAAAELITKRIAELSDWRGATLRRMRKLIKDADPEVIEEWKWMGTPVWSHAGIICTGESYKKVVKLTFAKGASLKDPTRLFNSSLDGNVRRAIDIHEGEEVDAAAFTALVRQAVALNSAAKPARSKKRKS
jgi:hypothetical protein